MRIFNPLICAILLVATLIGFKTIEARTLYIITIQGADSGMREECEQFANLFKGNGRYHNGYEINHTHFELKDYNKAQNTLVNSIGRITGNAKAEDAVIVYVSTHGMFYREQDGISSYYYCAYSMPSKRNIHDSTKIQALLTKTNCDAHLKLFVSDTCSSRIETNDLEDTTDKQQTEDDVLFKGTGNNGTGYSQPYNSSTEKTINSYRFQTNIKLLMNAEGYYYVSASIRGNVALGNKFLEMFKITLSEVDLNNVNAGKRFDTILTKLEENFKALPKTDEGYLLRIYWEDCDVIHFGEIYQDEYGHIHNIDHSDGIIVVYIQNSHEECPAMKAKLRKGDIVLGYILSNREYFDGAWTYMNQQKDTFQLSKEMQNQRFLHLLVMRLKYDPQKDLYFYKKEIVKNIDLDRARENMKAMNNDLKFGMAAFGYDEINRERN